MPLGPAHTGTRTKRARGTAAAKPRAMVVYCAFTCRLSQLRDSHAARARGARFHFLSSFPLRPASVEAEAAMLSLMMNWLTFVLYLPHSAHI